MSGTRAYAKVNLALVVGPLRSDGKHEVVTVLQAIDLHDEVELEPADALSVEGFAGDTLVRAALEALAREASVELAWRARLAKRIPVAAGLGGGSSDAAAALRLANETLPEPLGAAALHELAATLGADVPFFLRTGPQLATGDGTELASLDLRSDYVVVVVLPSGETKTSTESVYGAFDERGGADGFAERRAKLLESLAARDLRRLPPNDLASSPLVADLSRLGALHADVTGAGPAVYGLFDDETDARRAASALAPAGRTWLAHPVEGVDPTGG